MADRFDVVVVGTGAAGLAAALALGRAGLATCLVGPPPATGDGRTAALLDGSLRLLAGLGIGPALERASAPLRRLRIVDDTPSLFRPPPVVFEAAEIGLDAFGRNVENATLVGLLAEAVAREPAIVWRMERAAGLDGHGHDRVRLEGGGMLAAGLVVAADGRGSRLRAAAGIAARDRRLPQAALTAILDHDRDHGDASTEFHRRGGPFTLVPLPGRRSSLVWVDGQAETGRRAALPDRELARAIETDARGLIGRVAIGGARATVPLGILTVERLSAGRLVLLGEAGHALPPIGAQGLNIGLADVRALAGAVADARRHGADIGSPATLAAYARARKADIRLRSLAVEGLNAALLSSFAPVDAVRGLGLGLLARISPLRRAVMRAGLMGDGQPAHGTMPIGSQR